MSKPQHNDHLLSIQYLRAIAALMVVFHHAINSKPWLFNPLENYTALATGVDIFFVISGFIMYVAARNEAPFEFLRKRIIRIVPLYWVATLAFVLVKTKLHVFSLATEDLLHIFKSLAFIPQEDPTNPGKIWPYLIQGWTLNYEMFFYLIFFVGLMIKNVIAFTSITILVLFVVGQYFGFQSAPAATYTSPLLLEFLIGIWLGILYTKAKLNNLAWLIPVGFAGLLAPPIFSAPFPNLGDLVFASIIIAGAASLGKNTPNNQFAKLLGDASYSIYLTHVVISLRLVNTLFKMAPVSGWLQFVSYVSISMILSALIGVLIHLYVEKPMLNWLRKMWH